MANLETQALDLDDEFVVLDADDFAEVAGAGAAPAPGGGVQQVGSAFKA